MGQEILESSFTAEDHEAFRKKLREETSCLKQWFDHGKLHTSDEFTVGLELEAWLVDENHLPAPENQTFLKTAGDSEIVEELSRFNFEINAPPQPLRSGCLSAIKDDLEARWQRSKVAAEKLKLRPLAIGILPTIRDEMLQPNWMSSSNRYRALNCEIFKRRQGKDLHIHIEGNDTLDYHCSHIMLEAACTSLQAHLKINPDEAARFYNAALLAAGPLVAASANAPFLYGKSLWRETRIPAFEQATQLDGFRGRDGQNIGRVTLGVGYVRESAMELFLENLSFETLLPAISEDSTTLPHLRLQNGTIWRWVRPILGFGPGEQPHLRLEHRVMSAGPSIPDTIANLALCYGLMIALARADTRPETETSFEEMSNNFYACARDGLQASIRWAGRTVNVQSLLLEELLPMARRALEKAGLNQPELNEAFDHTLIPRLRSGLTGAAWQRSYVDCNGWNFQALTERYAEMQATNEPVHLWTI